MYKFIFISVLLCFLGDLYAQKTLIISTEAGENYSTNGFYSEVLGGFSYQVDENWKASVFTGLYLNNSYLMLKGLKSTVSRSLTLKDKPLNIELFYLWKPFSERVEEHNAALILSRRSQKFDYSLGLYSRTFNIRNKYYNTGNFNSKSHTEPLNLMYHLSYYLIENEQLKWQIGFGTYDSFIIQQETNPMFLSALNYQLNEKLILDFNLGYIQSGLLNIRVNYYGFYLRGGIRWMI